DITSGLYEALITQPVLHLQAALTSVQETIKTSANMPIRESANIVINNVMINFLATDRLTAIEHEIAYKTDAEMSYVQDAESLQLLAKLPPLQEVDFTTDGVVVKNIKFTPADLDFPTVTQNLIDAAWKDEWLDDEEQGAKSRNAG